MASTLAPGRLFTLDSLVTPTAQGIASRVLARTAAGNITLFAFDAGEELSEHTAPFDALALTVSGALVLTIGWRSGSHRASDDRADASECPACRPRHRGLAHVANHAARSPLTSARAGFAKVVREVRQSKQSGACLYHPPVGQSHPLSYRRMKGQ